MRGALPVMTSIGAVILIIGAAVVGPIEHTQEITKPEMTACAFRVLYTDRKGWSDLSADQKKFCRVNIICRRSFQKIGAYHGKWYPSSYAGLGSHLDEAGSGRAVFQIVPHEWFPDAWSYRGERTYCLPVPKGWQSNPNFTTQVEKIIKADQRDIVIGKQLRWWEVWK